MEELIFLEGLLSVSTDRDGLTPVPDGSRCFCPVAGWLPCMLSELDRADEDVVSFLLCAHAVAAARSGDFTDARRLFALRFDDALLRQIANILSPAPAATGQQLQPPEPPEQHGDLLSSAPAAPAQLQQPPPSPPPPPPQHQQQQQPGQHGDLLLPQPLHQPAPPPWRQPAQQQHQPPEQHGDLLLPQQLHQPAPPPGRQPAQHQLQQPAQIAHRLGESGCGGDLLGSRADAGPRRGTDHQFVHQMQHLNPLLAATPRTGAQQIAPVPSQSSASPPPVYARNGRLLQCHYCRGNPKQHVCPVWQRDAAHVPASRPTSSVGRQNGFACGGPGLLPTPLICVVADGGQAKPGTGRMGPGLLPAARRWCPGHPWWRAASHRHRRRQSAAPRLSAALPARGRQRGAVYHDAGLRTMSESSGLPESPRAYRFVDHQQMRRAGDHPPTAQELEGHHNAWKEARQRRTMLAALSYTPNFDAPSAEELEFRRPGTPMRLAAAPFP